MYGGSLTVEAHPHEFVVNAFYKFLDGMRMVKRLSQGTYGVTYTMASETSPYENPETGARVDEVLVKVTFLRDRREKVNIGGKTVQTVPDREFEKEVRMMRAAQLSVRRAFGYDISPEIVSVFKAELPGSPHKFGVIVMEYLKGFRELGPRDYPAGRRAYTDLMRVGISHGDPHPGNTLVRDGHAYVIDYGAAEFVPASATADRAMEDMRHLGFVGTYLNDRRYAGLYRWLYESPAIGPRPPPRKKWKTRHCFHKNCKG